MAGGPSPSERSERGERDPTACRWDVPKIEAHEGAGEGPPEPKSAAGINNPVIPEGVMAKYPKRRRMGRYIRGNVNEVLALGTLASLTGVIAAFDDTVEERTLISSIIASYALEGYTGVLGDGPVMVGIAHGDYSLAEIEAWIENAQGWQEGDHVAREVGARLVRVIGTFGVTVASDAGIETLNDGKKIKTKLNWILNASQTLTLWAYNLGSGALTTGSIVHANGHVNLFPK